MELTKSIDLAASLGGFAGLAFLWVVWFIGRRVEWMVDAMDRHTKMEIVRLITSNHTTPEAKDILAVQLQDVDEAVDKRKSKK